MTGDIGNTIGDAKGLTSSIPKSLPTVPVPKIDSSVFTGTVQEMTSKVTDQVTTLIGTITAPLLALQSTIDNMYSTYEAAVSTSTVALEAAKWTAPGTVSRLKKEIERATTYKAKVDSIRTSLNDTTNKVQEYVNYGNQIVKDAQRHSMGWIEEKVNWVLAKIAGYVQIAVDDANKQMNSLIDKAKETARKSEEQAKEKAEAKAKALAEQIAARQKKQQEKKAKNQQAIAKA